jgi:hypothetical protein
LLEPDFRSTDGGHGIEEFDIRLSMTVGRFIKYVEFMAAFSPTSSRQSHRRISSMQDFLSRSRNQETLKLAEIKNAG